MKVQPITNKPQPTFGIYISTKQTPYGECVYGNYKGYNIFHKTAYLIFNEFCVA